MPKLYKYGGPDILNRAFAVPGDCRFRCSYPRDFNDPYELFLTIGFEQEADILAYYREIIGEIPQHATTCFSAAPDVVPMWAHYARNHEGAVIEVDEERLSRALPGLTLGDVEYRDDPNPALQGMLERAHGTCKPRHVYFFQKAVFGAAYFTKHSCWSYEQERRLVARDEFVRNAGDLVLLTIPADCVTAVIVGQKAVEVTKNAARSVADQLGCAFYEMRVGISTARPYFMSAGEAPNVFIDGEIRRCVSSCAVCQEPVPDNRGVCSWCAIGERDEDDAAFRNPMRTLSRVGLLEGYYKSMEAIRRSHDG